MHPSLIRSALVASTMLATATGVGVATRGQGTATATHVVTACAGANGQLRVWRYPPHTRGRRHSERVQEEVFVVLSGEVTMLLGEPPERADLLPRSIVSVAPGTALQVRNESDEEAVVFVYGAPPVGGQAEILDDVEL